VKTSQLKRPFIGLDLRQYEATITTALKRSRRSGKSVIASHSEALTKALDPSAAVYASRQANEQIFCFEQPAYVGSVVAGLGSVCELEATGDGRFQYISESWRGLIESAVTKLVDDLPGSGLIACGGFAFTPQTTHRVPHWRSFGCAKLTIPEITFARRGEKVCITVNRLVAPDDTAQQHLDAIESRLAQLSLKPLPMLDPDPTTGATVVSLTAPEHYVGSVARAVERICTGKFEKIVLAREVQVHTSHTQNPAAVFGVLREAFPECYVFCVDHGDGAFLGASPELLIRREGLRASTVALAGSIRRSADPAVDAHLGEQLQQSTKDRSEQGIVVERIKRALEEHALWVTAAEEPALVKVANIQHLGTPIRAQLKESIGAIDLVGALHPTPAVGGEPFEKVVSAIAELEGLDRGWYAGPVGWIDANEDGEFCVALRCALLRDRIAHCYAGVGVVRDSDPEAELAETELKLAALLPVLAG